MEKVQNNTHLSALEKGHFVKPASCALQGTPVIGKIPGNMETSNRISPEQRVSRGCMTPTQSIEDFLSSDVKTPDASVLGRTFFTPIEELKKQKGSNKEDDDEDEVRLINLDEYKSTHHLLKHYLSDGQRIAALKHFDTHDVKDAAKLVSKMGQRELQQKFKLVYGTTTHSNNNEWLRRKLYEAIGAAPAKLPAKSRSKKVQPRGKKSKSKLSSGIILEKQRRSRKISSRLLDSYQSYPGGLPRTPTVNNSVARSKSVSGSSPFKSSVVDMHKYIAMDYFSTSDEDIVSGMIPAETEYQANRHNNSMGSLSDQTVAGTGWRKNSFDSYESLGFSSEHSLPILFGDDITEWDISEAERRKSTFGMDKKLVDWPHQASIKTMATDEDEDLLLPVDSSAFNLVEILKEFL